jgi:hypothetical protein
MPYKNQEDKNEQQLKRYHQISSIGTCPYCGNPCATDRKRCYRCGINDRVKKLGLSKEEKLKVLSSIERAKGVCEICGGKNSNGRDLHIDHCHQTNKFRGFLCHKCNSFIGYANENVGILSQAIAYLEKHSGNK